MSRAVRLDASLVRLDKCLGDRQPDTCSTVLPIAGGIGAIEAIEQSVQMLGRNSVAVTVTWPPGPV